MNLNEQYIFLVIFVTVIVSSYFTARWYEHKQTKHLCFLELHFITKDGNTHFTKFPLTHHVIRANENELILRADGYDETTTWLQQSSSQPGDILLYYGNRFFCHRDGQLMAEDDMIPVFRNGKSTLNIMFSTGCASHHCFYS